MVRRPPLAQRTYKLIHYTTRLRSEGSTLLRPARLGEWQTQRTQNALLFGACGFKSRPGHPAPFTVDQSSDRPRSADQLHAGPVALDVDRCYVRAGNVD